MSKRKRKAGMDLEWGINLSRGGEVAIVPCPTCERMMVKAVGCKSALCKSIAEEVGHE